MTDYTVGTAAVQEVVDSLEALKEKEESARNALKEAQTEQEEALAKMQEVLLPLRHKRDALLAEKALLKRKVASLRAELRKAQASIKDIDTEVASLHEEVERMGIPVVLIGAKRTKRAAMKTLAVKEYERRKSIQPGMVGKFGPIVVRGSRKHSNRMIPCVLMLEGDGELFYSKRVDRNGKIEKDLLLKEYTHVSARLSDVTTQAGWLDTKDVAFAIVTFLNRNEEFTSLVPNNAISTLAINGKRITEYLDDIVEGEPYDINQPI